MTQEDLRALKGDYQSSDRFTDAEKAVIRWTEQVTRNAASIPDADFEQLKKHFNHEQIVELTLVTCMANLTNRFNDSLHVPLDEGLSAAV